MSHIHITEALESARVEAVLALAESAREHDGIAPLSEQTLLRVRHGAQAGGADVRFHLLYEEAEGDAERLAGFGFAERSPDGGPDSGELVVAPGRRLHGYGTWLLNSLADESEGRGLRVWAHGGLPGARALARSAAAEQVRGLLKMRLALRGADSANTPALSGARLSDEARERLDIRPFAVGRDEQEWLRTNARAFADHPEQGGITLDDLRQREAEAWFDPAGFFVAADRSSGRIAGFHWTKTHADGAGLADEPVGEVYVVGVDPTGRAPAWGASSP